MDICRLEYQFYLSQCQRKYAPKSLAQSGPQMPTLQWRAPLRTMLPLRLSYLLQQYSRYWQLVSTGDMHLLACRARSIVPVPACLCPAQPTLEESAGRGTRIQGLCAWVQSSHSCKNSALSFIVFD